MKLYLSLLLSLPALLIPPCLADTGKDSVKIGGIFSLSSWAAVGGQAELNASLLAKDDINAQGGINGRPLEIVFEDNQSDLARTVTAYRKLVSVNKIPALLGPNWAEFAEVTAPLAEQDKIPMLTASGFSWTLTRNRRFIFTALQNFNDQVAPLGAFIAKQKHERLAILHSSSTYFDGIAEGLKSALEQKGMSVASYIALTPKESDLRSVVLKLQKQRIDAAVLFLQEGGDLATLIRQLRTLKYSPALYAGDISYDDVLMKDLALADGLVFMLYTGKSDPALEERYRKRFGFEPLWTVAKAYDNVFVLKAAMERCGLSPEQIRDCLIKTDYQGLSGHIQFGSDGIVRAFEPVTQLRRIEKGSIVSIE